jgi:hypothetical protein
MRVQQFTTIFHAEYGKGSVVSITPKGKDALIMVFFPSANEHDWVLLSSLQKNTDDFMSLEPMTQSRETIPDDIEQAIKSLFFGGGQS